MNRICNTCNIEIDENNYLKDRTVCKTCYNKNRRKNTNEILIQNHQPKIDNSNNNKDNNPNLPLYENKTHVVIDPRNVGKTYYTLKMLEKSGNKRPIHIITRYPNHYPNYKTSIEIKPINKNTGSVVIFDDMLGARNSSQMGEFYTRSRHEGLNLLYVNKSYFGLPRQSIRNNSDRITLFRQTLKDVQDMYYDIGAYDMKYDEIKGMCHKACSERLNYLSIGMTKNENEGKCRIFNESKTTFIECFLESEAFY